MQTKIHSMIKTKVGWEKVTVFGYSNKSIPGLEIQGLGQLGRNMKEKFVFICKERKISFPFKRYVLCIDLSEMKTTLDKDSVHYLELPFLMIFFYLGGLLPIRTLSDCFSVGRVSVSGKIIEPPIPLENFESLDKENFKVISTHHFPESQSMKVLATHEILENIPMLHFNKRISVV